MTKTSSYRANYPLFLDLFEKKVVVIGGGAVAERKAETLLQYGACVVLISPDATPYLSKLAEQGQIEWIKRVYQRGDLQHSIIAFCACGVPEVDVQVKEEAQQCGCLLNVVDVPLLCDFMVPSIVRRGLLSIAISTSGAACSEARNIRLQLEDEFDDSWEPYLDLMASVRDLIKLRFTESDEQRKPYLKAAVAANFRTRLAVGELISPQEALEEIVFAVENTSSKEASALEATIKNEVCS